MNLAPLKRLGGLRSRRVRAGVVAGLLTLAGVRAALFAAGVPPRVFLPISLLFVAQAIFNGVAVASSLRELEMLGATAWRELRSRVLNQTCVAFMVAVLALGVFTSLSFIRETDWRDESLGAVAIAGGLVAAAALMLVFGVMLGAVAGCPVQPLASKEPSA